jgi:hypothetical protein
VCESVVSFGNVVYLRVWLDFAILCLRMWLVMRILCVIMWLVLGGLRV